MMVRNSQLTCTFTPSPQFGPVVDHLPLSVNRGGSRGGSTVDALATVSELVDNDGDSYDEGDNDIDDAWNDDLGDIDLSEHPGAVPPAADADLVSTEPADHAQEEDAHADKGMTVRFRSVVAAIFEQGKKGGEDVVAGADAAEENGWGDDFDFDDSTNMEINEHLHGSDRFTQFSEAETPPATPYSHFKPTNYLEMDEEPPEGVALPDFGLSSTMNADQCNSCANATTIDCPCVQRILKSGINGDDSIKIDYQMLLQTEISKRRLLEEESKYLRAQLEAVKDSKSAGEVNMETVQTLQEYVTGVEAKLRDAGDECALLRQQNQELQSSLSEAKAGLDDWARREEEWKSKESGMREEIERTEQQLKLSSSESARTLESKEKYFLGELEQRDKSAQKLSDLIGELQAECSGLRNKNQDLLADLNAVKQSLAQQDEERDAMASKESHYEQEIVQLRSSLEYLERQRSPQDDDSEKVKTLSEQLESKDSESQQLRIEIQRLTERLEFAEGERNLVTEDENLDLQLKIDDLEVELQQVRNEKEQLEKKLLEGSANEELSTELKVSLEKKTQELLVATEEMSELKEHFSALESELELQKSLAENAETVQNELQAVADERDGLRGTLSESNETIRGLQQRLEDQSVFQEKRSKETESLRSQLSSLKTVIEANKKQIEALQKKSDRITGEKDSLQKEISAWKAKCKALEEAVEDARLTATEDESNQIQIAQELESLRYEVASFAAKREELNQEQETLRQQCCEMEFSLNEATKESELNVRKVSELEQMLSEANKNLHSLREEKAAITNERNQHLTKCNEMEQSLAGASESSQEVARLIAENASMSNEIQRLQQYLENQKNSLQNLESRTTTLEEELNSERQFSSEKDDELSELRRQLEETLAHLEESSEGQNAERVAELETMVANLEADRREYENTLALYSSKEQEFNEISQSLSQDREEATKQRDTVVEENEEMLVQFGYLNEQIDSYQQQIQDLEELVERYKNDFEANETRFREMQLRLEDAEKSREENGEQRAFQAGQTDAELSHLRQEHQKLLDNIDELTTTNSTKDATIRAITGELEGVRSQLEDIEQTRREAEATARANDELRAQLENLEYLRNDLDERCNNLNDELSRVQCNFDASQNASSMLQSRVDTLERACSDRDRWLQQKDVEMRELMDRLYEASGESEETQEVVMLRERLNQMEHSAIESADRVNEMESRYEMSQEELNATRGKVSALESTVADLEGQLRGKDEEASNAANQQENALSELENKLQAKAKTIAELTKEKATLEKEIEGLKSQSEAQQEQVRHASVEEEKRLLGEIENLSGQLTSLQQQLSSSSEEHHARELSLQDELKSIQRKLASKDGEIMMMKRKLETADEQLQDSREQMQANQQVIDQMSSEVESLKAKQSEGQKGHSSTAAKLLQQSKENAEDVDNLRSTVISLAVALETSEMRRADAIDRLLKERETHAESLRRLADSVKRFYATLSHGET